MNIQNDIACAGPHSTYNLIVSEFTKPMSVQAALNFIRWFRINRNSGDSAPDLSGLTSLEQLKSLGKSQGWEFSLTELREAHAHDWRLRWRKFNYSDSSSVVDRLL